MVQRGAGGHVVNVASAAGYVATGDAGGLLPPRSSACSASPRRCATSSRRHGIGVTCVCPGHHRHADHARREAGRARSPATGARERMVDAYRAPRLRARARRARACCARSQRNRAVAPITPEAWVLYYAKRFVPGLLARAQRGARAPPAPRARPAATERPTRSARATGSCDAVARCGEQLRPATRDATRRGRSRRRASTTRSQPRCVTSAMRRPARVAPELRERRRTRARSSARLSAPPARASRSPAVEARQQLRRRRRSISSPGAAAPAPHVELAQPRVGSRLRARGARASGSAVARARSRSLVTSRSTPASASSRASASACSRPRAESGGSSCPCQRPSAFQTDSAWRISTSSVARTAANRTERPRPASRARVTPPAARATHLEGGAARFSVSRRRFEHLAGRDLGRPSVRASRAMRSGCGSTSRRMDPEALTRARPLAFCRGPAAALPGGARPALLAARERRRLLRSIARFDPELPTPEERLSRDRPDRRG